MRESCKVPRADVLLEETSKNPLLRSLVTRFHSSSSSVTSNSLAVHMSKDFSN